MTSGVENGSQSNKDLGFIAVVLAGALVFFELWMAAHGHSNERAQHLGGAVAYAKGHIDLLRPMLLGFTANGSPTPLEFPIWQACTAVLMKCFGLWHGWGNVVSLIFYLSSLWPLFDLCRRLGSARIGWWTVIFTLIQPLSWLVGAQAGGDSTAWAFAAWFIYAAFRMMTEGSWKWWLFSLCAGALSAVTKAPFFAAAGLTTFLWLWFYRRNSRRAWMFLGSAGIVSILFFLVWNVHCHRVYAEAVFSTMNLDPLDKSSGIHSWYFETLSYRLHIANWLRGGWHLAFCVFGGFALIFLVLVATRLKHACHAWLWLLGSAATAFIFPSLILEHLHYFLIFAPAIAWLCALGAAEIESKIRNVLPFSAILRTAVLLLTLGLSLIQALATAHFNAEFDPYPEQIGHLIDQHTGPKDKIVIWGMNWGDPFLFMERQGFTGALGLDGSDWINDPQKLNRLKQLGYTKIALVNLSPFTVALVSITTHVHNQTDAGNRKMVDLHEHIPAIARNWPTVYDSPQLLILQIPGVAAGN